MKPHNTPDKSSATAYAWAIVGMLWFVCFFNYADRQTIPAVAPLLEKQLGFSKTDLGWIGSAFMWIYAAMSPFAGYLGDRFSRKRLILWGCLFWSAVTMMTAWCSSVWHFVLVRALEGFGEAFYFPASMALVSLYHSSRTRSRAMAWHQSSVYLGTIAGSWGSAWLAEHWGWRTGFYVFGGAGIILAIVLNRTLLEPKSTVSADAPKIPFRWSTMVQSWGQVFRTPGVPWLMAAFVCANFVATIFLYWMPTFLFEKFQYRLSTAGLSATLFVQLASAVTVPFAGWWADYHSRRRSGGRIRVQRWGLLLGIGLLIAVGKVNDRSLLLLVFIAFGIAKGLYDSGIFASMYDLVPDDHRATAAGLMNMVGWMGGALGPVFVGWISQHGTQGNSVGNMSWAIGWSSVAYVLGAAFLTIAIRRFHIDKIPMELEQREISR